MNKRYLFLSVLLVSLGIIMAFLPEKRYTPQIEPEQLLSEINSSTRFISCDDIANKLIEGDPLLLLIDVRTPEEYAQFSLPGSLNIPLDSLLVPELDVYIDQPLIKKVLYSNGSIYANQAWVIYRRKAYKNLYVMEGGLNSWVETILQPVEPKQTASKHEFEQYKFRVAASQYFGGGNQDVVSSSESKKPAVKSKRKKAAAEGGCS